LAQLTKKPEKTSVFSGFFVGEARVMVLMTADPGRFSSDKGTDLLAKNAPFC
tara:strand:+ start:657 stop:812 length:156 start_codon:yes stop_codon:yes gene_type:complete